MKKAELEQMFVDQVTEAGLAEGMVRQLRFAPPRLWRLDMAWPDRAFAVEIDGGSFAGGRHVRVAGLLSDAEKYATAMLLGWRILRVPGDRWLKLPRGQEGDPEALTWTRAILATLPVAVSAVGLPERTGSGERVPHWDHGRRVQT